MRNKKAPLIAAHLLREVSVAAEVDPRTVRKYLAGKPVQAMGKVRIENALRARDLMPPGRQP